MQPAEDDEFRFGGYGTPDEKPTYDELMSWMCTCGHTLEEHHISWFGNGAGGMWADECEAYGSNETGGCQMVDGVLVTHCQHFERAT